MNDFVLRGFCKKCEMPIEFFEDKPGNLIPIHQSRIIRTNMRLYYTAHNDELCGTICERPVWFLSARQMQIVFGSDEFEKWAGQENYFELCNNAFTLIVKVLEDKPFLVAKILKEAGEKEGENK